MPSYGREMAGKFLHFFLLLFHSIGGAVELARSRNKVHAKKRKISFSRNLCSAIYTYSTVYDMRRFCIRLTTENFNIVKSLLYSNYFYYQICRKR